MYFIFLYASVLFSSPDVHSLIHLIFCDMFHPRFSFLFHEELHCYLSFWLASLKQLGFYSICLWSLKENKKIKLKEQNLAQPLSISLNDADIILPLPQKELQLSIWLSS